MGKKMDIKNKAGYRFGEIFIQMVSLIYTKVFWRKSRLLRLPCRIRGKRNIEYGKGFTTGYACRIEAGGNRKTLFIGENVVIGDYAHIAAHYHIKIGDNVLMASRVYISDTSHGCYKEGRNNTNPEIIPVQRELFYKEVEIGDRVWIGENVCILPGVHIGTGSIIGANATVCKNIGENCIAVGNPARVIKQWNRDKQIWEKRL